MKPSRRILLTGASGGLGSALLQTWRSQHVVQGLGFLHADHPLFSVDLREPTGIYKLVLAFQPEIIVNTVAWTDVDACERFPEEAYARNVKTAFHIRQAAEAINCAVIHVSTNDVFDGRHGLYSEADRPSPLNVYARTKLDAEQIWLDYPLSLIVRTTFLAWYASGKQTFPQWIVRSLQAGQPIRLVQDQFYSPLDVRTLARWLEVLFDARGCYHLASERVSRWQAGVMLAQMLHLPAHLIEPVSIADFAWNPPRPADVSLCGDKLAQDRGLRTTFAAELSALCQDQRLIDDLQ